MSKLNRLSFLFKALQGLLMILPQGKCFDILKNRLKCINYIVNFYNSNLKLNEIGEGDFKKLRSIYDANEAQRLKR